MREIRQSGSEGGGGQPPPTPMCACGRVVSEGESPSRVLLRIRKSKVTARAVRTGGEQPEVNDQSAG